MSMANTLRQAFYYIIADPTAAASGVLATDHSRVRTLITPGPTGYIPNTNTHPITRLA